MAKNQKYRAILCIFLIVILGLVINVNILHLWQYDPGKNNEDIYYIWLEGKRILSGENPYERVLTGNMRDNDKYATYFPLFYLLASFTQLLGFHDFYNWLSLWRPIFLLFNIGISILIFKQVYINKNLILSLFCALLWLMGRWSIFVTKVVHIDFIPIFCLILSLILFKRHKYTSLILFGLSLALKQIAIFLIPLYLIWIWQSSEDKKIKNVVIAFILILLIPTIVSLPFIVWNAEGFVKSIIFSATRNPNSHVSALSLDALITSIFPEFVGIKAKLPMLFMVILLYVSTLQCQIGMYTSVLLTMSVFIDFNSVLFLQYFCWVVPFIPLAITEKKLIKNSYQRIQE